MNQREFLEEIERDISDMINSLIGEDNYYGGELVPLIEKIKAYLDDRSVAWHPAKKLPTPRIPLRMRLDDGSIVEGIRPSYIVKYSTDDLGYRDSFGDALMNVVEWSIV